MDAQLLQRYLQRQDEVKGWFRPEAASLFAWVDTIQKEGGIHGDLFEIGVHHGKSAILLGLMADGDIGERLGVCDLFDDQAANVTGSGRGARDRFLANMHEWFADLAFLRVIQKPSGDLSAEEVGGDHRFFHVDGGHSAQETFDDVALAASAILSEGVVAVDDYFNPQWPGVSEGVCRFLLEEGDRLAPLAIGFGKTLYCRPDRQAWYLDRLQASDGERFLPASEVTTKSMEFFGWPVLVYDRRPGPRPATPAKAGAAAAVRARSEPPVASANLPPLVVQMTPPENENPYFTEMVRHLDEARGWPVTCTTDFGRAREAFDEADSRRPAVLHFHQLDPIYRHGDPREAERRADELVAFVDAARDRGVGVVHTVHNRQRHDGRSMDLETSVVRAICGRSHRVVVLGEAARAFATSLVPGDRLRVVEHPNYVGFYGPAVPQTDARRELAVPPDDVLFVMLGGLKPYKGFDTVLDAFERAGLASARLAIVGGHPPDPEYLRSLEERVRAFRGRVRLVARRVEDEDVARWLGAADVAVFGFREILMSGSLLLALSYGLPVIAPDLGCLPEYVAPGCGWLYPPGDVDALADRLVDAATTLLPRPGEVVASVAHLTVPAQAAKLAAVYEQAAREAMA